MITISTSRSFNGIQGVYTHKSTACDCDMTFAVYVPDSANEPAVRRVCHALVRGHATPPGEDAPSLDRAANGVARGVFGKRTKRGQKDPKIRDFIRFAVSREGQDIIRKQGTVPYTEAMALVMKQLDKNDTAIKKGAYRTAVSNN